MSVLLWTLRASLAAVGFAVVMVGRHRLARLPARTAQRSR